MDLDTHITPEKPPARIGFKHLSQAFAASIRCCIRRLHSPQTFAASIRRLHSPQAFAASIRRKHSPQAFAGSICSVYSPRAFLNYTEMKFSIACGYDLRYFALVSIARYR